MTTAIRCDVAICRERSQVLVRCNTITFISGSEAHKANKQTDEQADRSTDRQKQTTSTNYKLQ